MNGYNLSRKIFDYAFEHKECGVYHISIYLWMVELNNRMGWKKEFGLPSHDTCDGLSIGNKNTYLLSLRDLEKWGFIKIIQEAKNQFSSMIVEICRVKIDTAPTTALDTALIQHSTQHGYAIDTIDKQRNKETNKQENNTFEEFYKLYPKHINRKDAKSKFDIKCKKDGEEVIFNGLMEWIKKWSVENKPEFIPAPDVWLNKEKYNDELGEIKPTDEEIEKYKETSDRGDKYDIVQKYYPEFGTIRRKGKEADEEDKAKAREIREAFELKYNLT